MLESSRARAIPKIVTMIAAVLVIVGMVMGGVLAGGMNDVISIPTVMLPRASRVRGPVIRGLFSFIGVIGGVRVCPACTSRVIRMLYVAVNAVASSVSMRAQLFRYDVFRFSMIRSFE